MKQAGRFMRNVLKCGNQHRIGEFNDYDTFFDYSMAIKRLGEIEDKIENGTLVELLCKVGNMWRNYE